MVIWVWLGAILLGVAILALSVGYLFSRAAKLLGSLSGLGEKLKSLEAASRATPMVSRPKSSLGEDPIHLIVERMRLIRAKHERKRQRERRLIKRLLSR